MSMRPRSGGAARLAPLAAVTIWGVNVAVMKAAIGDLHPFAFNAVRLTLSAAALWAAARILARGVAPSGPPPWGVVVLLAVLTGAGYQALFISGIERTSAGHTGLLIATQPLWTALIAALARVDRVDARAWRGLVVAFVGTALVVFAAGGGEATLTGNLMVLLAMVSWAAGTVRSRAVLDRVPAARLAFLVSLVSLPGHWALAAPHLGELAIVADRPDVVGAILFSGVLSTGLAYALWHAGVRRLGPARTAAFSNLVPLVALAAAWVWLGERPLLAQLAGGALIVFGIASWRGGAAAQAAPAARANR